MTLAKRPLALLVAAALIVTSSGCRLVEGERSLAMVRESGKLIVGVDPSYPPFAMIDEKGEAVGYEIDLAKEIARRLGVAPSFVGMDVGGMIDAVIARKIDVIISGLPPYPEYAKQLSYSRPYFNAGQVLVVKPGGPETLADLAGRTVGVESGSTGDLEMQKDAAEIKDLRLKSYTTAQAALEDVRAGRLDAAVTDLVTARQYLRDAPRLRIAGPPFTQEYYVVAGRRADTSLFTEIDKILGDLDKEGYFEALGDQWLR